MLWEKNIKMEIGNLLYNEICVDGIKYDFLRIVYFVKMCFFLNVVLKNIIYYLYIFEL